MKTPMEYRGAAGRFWDRVALSGDGDCWEWKGYRRQGYGVLSVDARPVRAHRLSFALANGFLPRVVMHVCDNPGCVNPAHLKAGTQLENVRDMCEKDRQAKGGDNGQAKLTREIARQVYHLRATGAKTQVQLAAIFGVSKRAIQLIEHRQNWAWATEADAA